MKLRSLEKRVYEMNCFEEIYLGKGVVPPWSVKEVLKIATELEREGYDFTESGCFRFELSPKCLLIKQRTSGFRIPRELLSELEKDKEVK